MTCKFRELASTELPKLTIHRNEGTKNYGQNIAAYGVSSGVPDSTKAVANAITDMWYYGEVNEFPFNVASPSTSGFDFLHFSQAVWKGSQTVGCASQTCAPNTVLGGANYQSVYTVCNYFPAGKIFPMPMSLIFTNRHQAT